MDRHRQSVVVSVMVVVLGLAGSDLAGAADSHLVDAVKAGDLEAIETLLHERADVNVPEADGTTALHWAVYRDDAVLVERLIAEGANAAAANRYGMQPVSLAALNGNASILSMLLAAGADVNTTSTEGETVLMTASRTGDLETVQVLVDGGADVNRVEQWRGQTALMWAAAEGHTDVVELLIDHGAEVSAVSKSAFTPLLFAAREGQIKAAEALLDAGASLEEALTVNSRRTAGGVTRDVGDEPGLNAFLLAVGNAHFELAAMLLDRGADPNAAPRGWTALHQMSWVRKMGISGSNDPAPTGSGNLGALEFVRKLVAHGADLNARVTNRPPAGITSLNFIGGTPFLLAARTADAEYMALLVELGADPDLTNEDGSTGLMVAAGLGTSSPGEDPGTESEAIEAVTLALELGADINTVDLKGETAMHGAAYKHLPEVVRLLVENGADINVWNQRNENGWTPLNIVAGIQRGMNIVSSPPTAEAIREVMLAEGVEPVFRSR